MNKKNSNSGNLIELTAVTKDYRDPKSNIFFQALRGIELTIKRGSISSIIGPSGSGKSTLLNILGGMLVPSTGRVTVDGVHINKLDPLDLINYRRYFCGFLWQEPEKNILPNLTVEENLVNVMEISGYPKEKREARINRLLQSVGLLHRRKHKIGQLSGGEAQRAGLAAALANEPKLLLADEPTGELDSETTNDIIRYLKKINEETGITIIVVTHDTRFERMTDYSFNIVDGAIASYRIAGKDVNGSSILGIRHEMSFVDQFGMVKIPPNFISKHKIKKFVKFEIDEDGDITMIPQDE